MAVTKADCTPDPSVELPDSLISRLTRLNIRVLAISLLLTFVLMATALWYGARQHQLQNALASAEVLANSIASSLVFSDKKSAARELAIFARRPEVSQVVLYDLQQQPFAVWPANSAQLIALTEAENAQYGDTGWHQLELQLPILLQQEQVGILRVQESLGRINGAVAWLIGLLALMTMLTLLLAGRGLRMVQQRVLAPIVELSELADYAARHQDYSQRGVIYQQDEVGRLTERLNELFKRTEIWQSELTRQLKHEQQTGAELKQLAHHDSLTGLPNRLYFQKELPILLQQSQQKQQLLALMFIDLDNFKTVNDSWGHDYGDAVLCMVANRMQQVLRNNDLLCRLGGDEFAVLLPGIADSAGAEQLADRLIKAVRQPMLVQQQLMPVGATVGIAFYPLNAPDAAQLLQKSDEAMYAAKKAGKNTYRTASCSTKSQVQLHGHG
jgi:diguanylate cyclase (GGDEF)-like protein